MESDFAVLFDWDGVVIDSSAQHEESWEILAAQENRPLPEDHFRRGFGKRNATIIPEILGWTNDSGEISRLGDRKEEIYRSLVRKEGVTILPGARQLLSHLQAQSIPAAIGSSTPRANLDAILDVTGLAPFFHTIVSGDDVTHGKPHPEVFLTAADRLGIPPSLCVVIEDALAGIEAAHRGGMTVVAVATTHPLKDLAHADLAVPSLTEVSPDRLRQLALSGHS